MGNPISPEASNAIRSQRSPFRLVRPRRTGFRHWLLENYNLLYTLILITTYATLTLFLVALIAFGGPSLNSKLLLGVFCGFVIMALVPWMLRGRRGPEHSLRRVLLTYRPHKTERIELIIGLILWSIIGAGIVIVKTTTYR
jgi:hypothetical protein